MATYEVDPISRIEGHLGVKVTETGGVITEADVHGNLWRGFENFLLGRDINDAITFTQRICGVCPVPHGMTSTYAADAVLGYSQNHITFVDDGTYGVPAKAVYMRNIVLGSEFLMSSITHFYHLAAPSYVQGPHIPPWTPYFNDADYNALLLSGDRNVPENTEGFSDDLWSTVIRSYVTALRIRRLTFEAGALFAGRMPMTSCYVGGGVTFDKTANLAERCDKFRAVMEEVGRFIVQEYVPIVLALGALYPAWDNNFNGGSNYGAGVGNFLAWGAFPNPVDNTLALPGGVWLGGNAGSLQFGVANKAQVLSQFVSGANSVPTNLKEDITNSRYADSLGEYDANNQAYPGEVSRTEPNRATGYTYSKAPRWDGNACEVGPFARLVVGGMYPLNGGTLAGTVPGYTAYVKTVNAVTGLDPKMIAADIAVALVRSGAATLQMWDGSDWTYVDNGDSGIDINTLDNATIVAAYTGVSAFGEPVITDGPVIELTSWIYNLKGGLSTMDRLRARGLESLVLVQALIGGVDKSGATLAFGTGDTSGWIGGLKYAAGDTWKNKAIPVGTFQGWGATEAPRGALMHQCTIENGKITKYQCIVPTTWNMSPKDYAGNRGPIEEAMIDVPYAGNAAPFTKQDGTQNVTSHGGVEALRVAQSFDPCIACAVH
jgi:hydrogenase large subunit